MQTWIDDEPHHTIEPLAPVQPYTSIDELPLPLRAKLIELSRKGMTIPEIATFFSLPVEWVHLFVECPPGSPEH